MKTLKTIQRAHLEKFPQLLDTLKSNPVPWREFDLRKLEGMENTYRIRIGNYRVIYFIDIRDKIIHILKFERRGKIY